MVIVRRHRRHGTAKQARNDKPSAFAAIDSAAPPGEKGHLTAAPRKNKIFPRQYFIEWNVDPMPFVRHNFKEAAAWRLASELMRRHHTSAGLKVFKTHPGGGMYDCLSFCLEPGKPLFDLNIGSGRLHLFQPYGKPRTDEKGLGWPEEDSFLRRVIGAHDPKEVVDEIEDLVGLPSRRNRTLPPTTAPVLVFRLMAVLLQRHVFSRHRMHLLCGWHDSSSMEGSYIKKELLTSPSLQESFPPETSIG